MREICELCGAERATSAMDGRRACAECREIAAAFQRQDLRIEIDADVTSLGARIASFAGESAVRRRPGASTGGVRWIHVISKPAGGEIRGYAVPQGALYMGDLHLRTPAHPELWPELDAAVAVRMAAMGVVLPNADHAPAPGRR